MSYNTVVVFTARTVEQILREGGTAAWRVNRRHAQHAGYVVCTRNAHHVATDGPEEHGSAFLIGKVSGVVRASDELKLVGDTPQKAGKLRYLIQFSEYARVNVPGVWKGDRNPVKYANLEELGIDVSVLEWEPMPTSPAPIRDVTPVTCTYSGPLTMAQAKTGLALTFGVPPEAIEITIRG